MLSPSSFVPLGAVIGPIVALTLCSATTAVPEGFGQDFFAAELRPSQIGQTVTPLPLTKCRPQSEAADVVSKMELTSAVACRQVSSGFS